MKIVRTLLPLLAVIYLTGCNTVAKPGDKASDTISGEEKVFIIPPIKDVNSAHNKLRYSLPYQYKLGAGFTDMFEDSIKQLLTGENTMEYLADTTKLHIKGDSCWLEYITAGAAHAKRKDGSFLDMPTFVSETTDTVIVR